MIKFYIKNLKKMICKYIHYNIKYKKYKYILFYIHFIFLLFLSILYIFKISYIKFYIDSYRYYYYYYYFILIQFHISLKHIKFSSYYSLY